MKIVFVLPCSGKSPVGGLKIVYEYANHLSARGHEVIVVHPAFQRIDTPLREKPRRLLHYLRLWLSGKYRPFHWFNVHQRVKLLWIPTLATRHIPDAEAVTATSWDTAEWVSKYPKSKGKRFYLIQGFGSWEGPVDRVIATWRLPLQKIVIAKWLLEIADKMEAKAAYIPNGLDFDAFGMDSDPQKRNPNRILMLYHNMESKGSIDGLAALRFARERVPSIEVDMFGVPPPPKDLPRWVRYHRNPAQSHLRRLYNQASIFVAPSWSEGWGLPACEAMQCGCALAATDIGGHREFCIHDQTALLSSPKGPAAMADNIVSLLQDQERRVRLALAGHEYIRQFTWDRATDAFEKILLSGTQPGLQ